MLETAWESRWMPDSIKNNSLNAIWNRTDISEWAELITKPVRLEGGKDMLTWFSRAVLFHITGFYQWFISSSLSRLWMTDKWSVKWLYIAVRKQSFLTHVQARYENKTLRRLMKASFQRIRNILFSQCTLKTAYWKSDTKFKPKGLKQISRHPRCYTKV